MTETPEAGLTLSPYPGLRSFRRDEADVFFGREQQVDQLLAKLEGCRFLAVVGVSGCGKSSLVRAGMLPALAGGFMASAGPRWHVVEMRPGGHPLSNLARALVRGNTLDEGWKSRPDAEAFVRAVLRRGPLGLVELLRESLRPSRDNLLLLVDQFEEIFRFHKHGDANEATAFVDLLLESARQEDVPIFVVITMRSDFLGDCSIFAGLPEAINQGQFLIPRLSREQCRAAVAGPAAAFGAAVQPELVNHVLNDIGSNPDHLPLMQHALMRVWSRASNGAPAPEDGELTLTLAEYQAVGGLRHALSDHADELYERLSPEDRRAAEVLFRCLSERGEDGRDIRRPVPLAVAAEVAQAPLDTIVRIVEVFREPGCSFLTPPAGVPLQADSVLDVSHESLIRQWHRMAQWVQAEADSAAIYRRLCDTAQLWKAGQAALWVTPDLENALCWRQREAPNAAWAERYGGRFADSMAFLDASVADHDRRLRAEKERQEHERELLQNMARAEKQRADDAEERRREQARANGQLKRRALAALATGGIAVVLAVTALVLFAQARGDRQRADDARAEAEQARLRAEAARARAAELADKEAAARQQSEQAELRAIEASDSAFRKAGQASLAQLQSLWVSAQPGRQEKAIAMLRDAAQLRDTALELARKRDPAQRDEAEQFWRQLTPQLRDEGVRWLALTSLRQVQRVSLTTAPPGFMDQSPFAISADLKYVAHVDTTAGPRKIAIRDPQTGSVVASQDWSSNRTPAALSFTADGATLLVASRDQFISGNPTLHVDQYSAPDLKTHKAVTLPGEGLSPFWQNSDDCFFDPKGARVLYCSLYGAVVWDIAAGKQVFADKQSHSAQFLGAGDQVLTVQNQSFLRVIDLKDGKAKREVRLSVDLPPGALVLSSPDGRWLATQGNPAYLGGTMVQPVLIYDLLTGEKVGEVPLTSSTDFWGDNARFAFHPSRPILTATNGHYLTLATVPGGGVLYQAPVTDAAQAGARRLTALGVQFGGRGDRLLTVMREPFVGGGEALRAVVQSWDLSLASVSRQVAWSGAVQDVCYVGDGAVAVAGVGDTRAGVRLQPLQGPGQWETQDFRSAGGFDPSGKHFVQLLADRFDVYDSATGRLRQSVSRKWPAAPVPLPADPSHRWLLGVDGGAAPRLRLFDATNLRWTAPPLLGGAATLQAAQFDDRGTHVVVTSSPPVGRGTGQSSTAVYRCADGARLLMFSPGVNEWKLTESGYLLSKTRDGNEHVLRAHEVSTGRVTETRFASSFYFSSLGNWINLSADGKSVAFSAQEGVRSRVRLWPFAEGKEPAQLLLDVGPNYLGSPIALYGDRVLTSGAEPARADAAPGPRGQKFVVRLADLKTGKVLGSEVSDGAGTVYSSEKYGIALVGYRVGEPRCDVWDLKAGRKTETFAETLHLLSPDRRFAVFTGNRPGPDGRTVSSRLLDLSTMKSRPLSDGPDVPGDAFVFSPDNRYLIASSQPRPAPGGGAGRVRVFDLGDPSAGWSPAESLTTPAAEVSPDGRLVGFYDRGAPDEMHVYSLPTGKKLGTTALRRGNHRPDQPPSWAQVAFSPDGAHVAVTLSDQICLGNTDQPRVHTSLPRSGHAGAVNAVAVSPDSRFLASAGADRTVCFWRVRDGRFLGMLDEGGGLANNYYAPPGPSVIRRVVFSPRGNLIALRKDGGEVSVWKWSRPAEEDAEITATFLWSAARAQGGPLAFSPDGTTLAAGEADGGLRLFHAESGQLAQWLGAVGPGGPVQALAFAPDGKLLAAARGPVVVLWEVAAAAPRLAWDAQQGPVHDLAYSDDGRTLVTAGRDVRLWDAATGELKLAMEKQASAVRQAALDHSGGRLAAVVDDRSVVVTGVVELFESLDNLGLKLPPGTVAVAARDGGLWRPQAPRKLADENAIGELLPRAAAAERARDWKQAAAHLTRLLGVEPGNDAWRRRRMAANAQRKDWPAMAEDTSYFLDTMPKDTGRDSPRSRDLVMTYRQMPELFAALEKRRADDPLPPLVRGRMLLLQSKWQEAKAAYDPVIRAIPAGEDWHDYAALCVLCGDRKAAHDHIAWMASLKGQPDGDYIAFSYARTAAVVGDADFKTRAVTWGEAGISKQRSPWYLHAAALAYYRAGQWDKARETLREALKAGWGAQVLNQLVLGMVEHKLGNDKAAADQLAAVREWRQDVERKKQDGYVNVLYPDWVEFNVLMPELEALVAEAARAAGPGQKP
ncbi:MAG TPA: AAA family ATPase [Gemmataceae bacterium]|nr:AAA family ATPase [Gemmataceae bacterium]